MNDSTLLLVGVATLFLAVAVAAMALLRPAPKPTGVARSLLTIEQLRLTSGHVPITALPASERLVRPAVQRLTRIGRRLTPIDTPKRLQSRLDVAGNPPQWSVERILAAKAAGLAAGVALGLLVMLTGRVLAGLLWVAGGAVVGFWLPNVLLYNAGLKRQEKVRRSLPDAMDMLTVCVEAGLGFDAGLAQVARNAEGPIAGEFARLLREMQLGKTRVEAFQDLAARTTVPELKVFVSALVQSDRLGIPLAGVLREQAAEMRLKRRQRAEEQAQKVPIKILFPLLLCIFPALFVVVIGPGAIQIAHTFIGHH
ncbi:MAG: type II secretion system F family protein [Actinomycetales bacterium]